jgi:hypothetical protein
MTRQVFYVDSGEEQVACLVARFGPQGTFSVLDQSVATLNDGSTAERTTLRTGQGDVEVEFREASPQVVSFTEQVPDLDRTSLLDIVMERAMTFAAANPPHHPGSLPRFPMPVEHYGEAVGVALPILAVDDLGRQGLYAPPRVVVVDWRSHEAVGAREFPGFDPEVDWPPRRLSDWPLPGVARLVPEQLEATIMRFGACWSRVIDAWFGNRDRITDVLKADVAESRKWGEVLDPPAMAGVYRELNPRFADWLDQVGSGRF